MHVQTFIPEFPVETFNIRVIRWLPGSDKGQLHYDAARRQVSGTIQAYEKSAPDFAQWLEDNIEEGLTVFHFPRGLWRKLWTSNLLENLNREIRRRTRLANLFPNKESCLRLVTAVVQEIHEDWITGKKYIDFDKIEEQPDLIYRKKVA